MNLGKIISLLELNNPFAVGNIARSLTDAYEALDMNNNFGAIPTPPFLKELLGPKIRSMRSLAAPGDKIEPPKSLGIIINALHGEARRVGARTAKCFMPEIAHYFPKGIAREALDLNAAEPLKAERPITLRLERADMSTADLTIPNNGLLYKAFLLAAFAKSFVTRDGNVKKEMKDKIGTREDVHETVVKLLQAIKVGLENSSSLAKSDLSEFQLSFNPEPIAQSFIDEMGSFANAYRLLFLATGGKLDPHLNCLHATIDPSASKAEFKIDTPKDAAYIFHLALCRYSSLVRKDLVEDTYGGLKNPPLELSQKLYEAPDLQTAATLLSNRSLLFLLGGMRVAQDPSLSAFIHLIDDMRATCHTCDVQQVVRHAPEPNQRHSPEAPPPL